MILMMQGGVGVKNLGKPDDVILERSLTLTSLEDLQKVAPCNVLQTSLQGY